MRHSATWALLLTAGLVLLAARSAHAAITFSACPHLSSLQCATLDVPLDRSGRVAGTVRLAALRRVAPSNLTNVAVVALAGGPGQAATPLTLDFAQLLAPALATRDLLVFDQRGTGASSPLRCRLSGSLTTAGRRCATELGAQRGQYLTAASVEDLEALRSEIGYQRLVLYGVSYGAKVALDYAARYPDRVESLVLDSAVPPEGPDTLQRSTLVAMRRVLGELCAGGACDGITTDPVRDLAGQVKRLARAPLRGRLTDARGRRRPATMDRSDLLNVVMAGDLNPALRAELPGAVTSARRGDASPLIRLVARSAGLVELRRQAPGDEFSDSVFAATLCEEAVFPWNRLVSARVRAQQARAVVRAFGPQTFHPFDGASVLKSEIIELCLGWPAASRAPAAAAPLPNVPTLVVSGMSDLRTPLEDANTIKALIPAAQVLSIPFTGHSTLASDRSSERCGARATLQFFTDRPVTPCSPGSNAFPPAPVAPTRLSALRPAGAAGRVGRTIAAAMSTAADVRRQIVGGLLELGRLPRKAGGLRGGRVSVGSSGQLTLRDVVYVPGVTVSGTLPLQAGGPHVLRIGGRKAARGTITVTPSAITGRLGGRRVKVTLPRARAASASPVALLERYALRRVG